MAHRQDLNDQWTQLNKGDWFFRDGIGENIDDGIKDEYIVLKWGDKENDVAVLKIQGESTKWIPTWQWDGNKESPTLSPSIRVMGSHGAPDLWHGYLRNGKLETC